jgi:prepilin-type N-terminal cleavage/methylation domain-containing protein
MRRQRGFTLMEIMIAMALASIVTTSVLAIVRTQLSAFEINDQVVRTQQGARAAMDSLETMVRRACGGISSGSVGVNVPGLAPKAVSCLRWIDGATVSATTFSTGSSDSTDAIEIVYATGAMTGLREAASFGSSLPDLKVWDISQFSVGDYILVGDNQTAWLVQIASLTPETFPTPWPHPGIIGLGVPGGTVTPPQPAPSLPPGSPVFKAATYSIFVGPGTAKNYADMLLVDAKGVVSNNHLDYGGNVQPAVEGVVDFQVATGADANSDGNIDQWYGDVAGETLPANTSGAWTANVKQVRMSLTLRTITKYSGAQPALTAFEDRSLASYPPTDVAYQPRYRSAQMIVAPRAWNLTE